MKAACLRPPVIALVDPMCPAGYDPSSLQRGGIGGTEATILRVGTALSPTFDMRHFQRGRSFTQLSSAGIIHPLMLALRPLQADVIIVINAWKVALKLRRINPATPILLWLHIHPGRHNRAMGPTLRDAGIRIICVSASHAASLRRFLHLAPGPEISHIYNPIDDNLAPDATDRDPTRLLFASSPHKGLAQVLAQFDALRRTMPDLALAVADPGYLKWDTGPIPPRVTFLGSLSHARLVDEMRRALCLFYPQTSFAETFGLVLAEANAVGTPVLAHRGLGANDEILGLTGQCIDAGDPAQIESRIAAWRREFPRIQGKSECRLSQVSAAWQSLLNDRMAQSAPISKLQEPA